MRHRAKSGKRLKRACRVLVLLVGFALVIEGVCRPPQTGVVEEVGRLATVDFVSQERGAETSVPQTFEDEVLSLAGYHDVHVGAGERVVGFETDGQPDAVFSILSERLANRGWMPVESGLGTGGTFVKRGGVYVWIFVSCMGVGDGTSVVVQCATTERER